MSHTPTPPAITARRNKVAQLLAHNPDLSARAIATRLDVSKDTIRRDIDAIRATPTPPDTPPPLTSSAPRAPWLIPDLPAWLIQDLNILTDPYTGQLAAPVAHAIHTAAEERRATWRTNMERRARHDTATAQ